MSETFTGDYAPNLFNENKRYYLLQAQEYANLTDAELRDLHNISNTNLRRFIQSQLGDSAISDGFKVVAAPSPTNNFKITGGDGSLDNPGVYYLNGYRLFLKNDILYSDQTNTGLSITDDAYTNTPYVALTTPTGTTNTINAVTLGTSFIACGNDGTLISTSDSGRNWSNNVSAFSNTLNDVDMGSASTGFAVGNVGTILKTTDSGVTWLNNPSGCTSLYGVSFISANAGWAVGSDGTILVTTNSGGSWSTQTSGVIEDLNSVSAVDSLIAWVVGDSGTILRTISGGTLWSAQTSGSTQVLNKVFAVDSTYVFAVGNDGTILRTDTSGATWLSLTTGTTNNLYGAYFKDRYAGWVVGQSGEVLHTTDSGTTWDSTVLNASVDFNGVVFSDTTGFVAGTNGTIYRTLDDGTSWDSYRKDYVYIDFHLAEVSGDATSGSEYLDSTLYDSTVGLPNANRLRVVQDVKVSEGWPAPSDYIGPDGTVQHYTSTIAIIQRSVSVATISQSNITDSRVVVKTISELSSDINNGGIDTSSLANYSVTPIKVDPTGDFTMGSLSLSGDATISGDLSVSGSVIVQDSLIIDNLNVLGSSTLGQSDNTSDSTVGINGRIIQNHTYNYPAYDLTVDATVIAPVFNIHSDGSGNIFHIERTSDTTQCLFDITNYGKSYDFCINHLGTQGGIFKIRDDASGDSVILTKNAPGFIGSMFNLTSNSSSPLFNIYNKASVSSVSINIDQTSGTIIKLNTNGDASVVNITSNGSGTDLKISHVGTGGHAIDVTSASTSGAMTLLNTAGQAVLITQTANADTVTIEKDGTGSGQALEVYNRGSDVGLGVYNSGTGVGQLISHVGISSQPGLDIFIAGSESGPGLRINKSNDTSGEVVRLWNQGISESLYIIQDNTDSLSSVIRIDNQSLGYDASSRNWWIDSSGNFFSLPNGSVSVKDVYLDSTGHKLSASMIWLDSTHMDSSNPGVAGRVFIESGYLRISDGTNVLPIAGATGPQGMVGQTGIQGIPSPLGEIPSDFTSLNGNAQYTSSSTYSDVLTTSITLDGSAYIYASMTFQSDTTGIGTYPHAGYRLVIDDSTGDELSRFIVSDDDVELGSIGYRAGIFDPGTYIVRGQFNRKAGTKQVRIANAQLYAQALQGDRGVEGRTGIQGTTGIQGAGFTGLSGETGIQGLTGPFGNTGVQGPAGGPSVIPTDYTRRDSTVFDTTSSVFVNLITASVTLNTSTYLHGLMTFESVSLGTGDYATGGYRVVIDDSTGDELEKFIQSNDEVFIGSVQNRSGLYGPGTYTAIGQVRLVSGERTLRVNDAQLWLQGQESYGIQGITGFTGETGLTGVQGQTGVSGQTGVKGLDGDDGVQGQTGLTGIQGQTGVGAQGITGLIGETGLTGVQGQTGVLGQTGLVGQTGLTGVQGHTGVGITGLKGVTGFVGQTGIQGDTGFGIQGNTGILGPTGAYGGPQGDTGFQGSTGIGSTQIIYGTTSRYSVVSTPGEEVWVVSNSSVYTGLPWDRSGTVLTMYRNNHGHFAGNRVIVRNTNMDYQVATIDSTTLNGFAITTTITDGTYGIEGAYSLGFTYAHSGSPKTGGVLSAPSGDHADAQLLTLRVRTGSRNGITYNVVVPASAVNGAGANTNLSDCFVPNYNVRTDSDSLSAVGATLQTNIGGSYSTFQIGALGTLSRMIVLNF